MPAHFPDEVDQLRWVHDLLINQSHIGGAILDTVVPVVMHGLAWLLPSDLVALFP
jgi:hypothetical protein